MGNESKYYIKLSKISIDLYIFITKLRYPTKFMSDTKVSLGDLSDNFLMQNLNDYERIANLKKKLNEISLLSCNAIPRTRSQYWTRPSAQYEMQEVASWRPSGDDRSLGPCNELQYRRADYVRNNEIVPYEANARTSFYASARSNLGEAPTYYPRRRTFDPYYMRDPVPHSKLSLSLDADSGVGDKEENSSAWTNGNIVMVRTDDERRPVYLKQYRYLAGSGHKIPSAAEAWGSADVPSAEVNRPWHSGVPSPYCRYEPRPVRPPKFLLDWDLMVVSFVEFVADNFLNITLAVIFLSLCYNTLRLFVF